MTAFSISDFLPFQLSMATPAEIQTKGVTGTRQRNVAAGVADTNTKHRKVRKNDAHLKGHMARKPASASV
jgi:hypothetical protein